MRSKLWIASLSSLVLVSGCVASTTSECDWTETLYYGSDNVVDWLAANDPSLLAGVTSHNEKRMEFCK
jgi:hypothetical protein